MLKADLRAQLEQDLGSAFVFERELGGGGMSRVFLATERALGRSVVLKVLPPELAGEVSVERFRREVALTARLQHPNIVPVIGAGETSPVGPKAGLLYYTMPYVDGESLRARVERIGRLPMADAISVIRDVARALAFAQTHGIVHRDLKPENILLAGEAATVTDFGIAKALERSEADSQDSTPQRGRPVNAKPLTSVGVAVGTPAYMAPEQIAVDPSVDHRSDLYALGVVAYEILAGAHPFAGKRAVALLAAHATEKPEPIVNRRPGISPRLAALVMSLLEKRPEDRPQSAENVLRTLDHIGSAHTGAIPAAAPVQPVPSNKSTFSPRTWYLWVIVVVTLAILVLVVVALNYFVSPSRRAADSRPGVPASVVALASTDRRGAGWLDRAQKVHSDSPLSVTGADPGIME
jgi:eukaryotic-like serine/threonine-protein kinase